MQTNPAVGLMKVYVEALDENQQISDDAWRTIQREFEHVARAHGVAGNGAVIAGLMQLCHQLLTDLADISGEPPLAIIGGLESLPVV